MLSMFREQLANANKIKEQELQLRERELRLKEEREKLDNEERKLLLEHLRKSLK